MSGSTGSPYNVKCCRFEEPLETVFRFLILQNKEFAVSKKMSNPKPPRLPPKPSSAPRSRLTIRRHWRLYANFCRVTGTPGGIDHRLWSQSSALWRSHAADRHHPADHHEFLHGQADVARLAVDDSAARADVRRAGDRRAEARSSRFHGPVGPRRSKYRTKLRQKNQGTERWAALGMPVFLSRVFVEPSQPFRGR